jgi:acyl-CoA synthetase (NDP forming)
MDHLFHPQSLVVIGVSENPDNLPRIIAENIFRYQYRGDVYLYGRKKGNIDGHEILDSFEALPDGIELAIILTPAATVPAMVEACGKKGIQTAIIETGGFAETSANGEALGQEVLAIARRYQMRLVGPNCVGIVSSAEGINSIFVKM